jgi:hypothetical protein
MDKHRVPGSFGLLQHLEHCRNVVSVHRPQIGNSHILKEHSRHYQMFKAALSLADALHHSVAYGNILQSIIYPFLNVKIGIGCPDVIQILGHPAHIFGNGHIIVI